MRKLLIHIGRHKTGTTAIQRFLQDNRDPLKNFGFFIPQAGRVKDGHHAFARPFQPRHAAQLEGVEDFRSLLPFVDLTKELADQNPESTAIISSEGFQNCRPRLVSEAFRDYDAQIVVYLRNQFEYLASSYAQRVHATPYTGTLENFYKDVYLKGNDYANFLRLWNDQFPDRLSVRRYVGSSIVDDFITHTLRIPSDTLRIREARSNPSLNNVITQFKLELNRRQVKGAPSQLQIYPLLPLLNDLFPSAKFALPTEIARDLVANCRDSDNEVAATYFGETVLFDYTGFTEQPELKIDNALFNDIYAALIAKVAEAGSVSIVTQ